MSSGPWTPRWTLGVGAAAAAGALLCAAAWTLASGRAAVDDQIGFAGLSVLGLTIAFCGNVVWLSQGRRAVGERAEVLLGDVGARATRAPVVTEDTPSGDLVGGSGLRWFHRRECPIAAGQPWPAAPREEHERAGRAPCRVCRP